MASRCKNEKEYLLNAKKIIRKIRGLNKENLSDMFFGLLPDKVSLHLTLDKILASISEVEKIPEVKRHYEF